MRSKAATASLLWSPRLAQPAQPSLGDSLAPPDMGDSGPTPPQSPSQAPTAIGNGAGQTLERRVPSSADLAAKQRPGSQLSRPISTAPSPRVLPAPGGARDATSARRWFRPPVRHLLLCTWLAVTALACLRLLSARHVTGQTPPGNGTPLALRSSGASHNSSAGQPQQKRKPFRWPVRQPKEWAPLWPLAVRNESADPCAQELHIPKVALLFLTPGPLPQEPVWRDWFAAAEGQLPAAAVTPSSLCSIAAAEDEEAVRRLRAACGAFNSPSPGSPASHSGILQRQHLFSVYVHAPPDFPGYPPGSLFGGNGTLVPHRVRTWWGSHSLVVATRNLLLEAAADPANQRFVLVSETDIPLYDPLTTYQQLLSERRSRVNACGPPPVVDRWWRKRFNSTYWRKSSQFFMLTRPHAELVLGDVDIFRAPATAPPSNSSPQPQHPAVAAPSPGPAAHKAATGAAAGPAQAAAAGMAAHYLPTLLAVRGLVKECACEGQVAHVEWKGGPHPRTFLDISAGHIDRARGPSESCPWRAAQRSAQRMFVLYDSLEGLGRQQVCKELTGRHPGYNHPLAPTCPITARKFAANTSQAVLALYMGAEGTQLGLLRPQQEQEH
ncbi:hypothetical protein N2152v2_004531 [Parachlorella kessleri]